MHRIIYFLFSSIIFHVIFLLFFFTSISCQDYRDDSLPMNKLMNDLENQTDHNVLPLNERSNEELQRILAEYKKMCTTDQNIQITDDGEIYSMIKEIENILRARENKRH